MFLSRAMYAKVMHYGRLSFTVIEISRTPEV